MCGRAWNDLTMLGQVSTLLSVRQLLAGSRSPLDFSAVLPPPAEVDGVQRSRWCLEHWGSSTGSQTDARLLDDDAAAGALGYVFSSAGRPPLPSVVALAQRYPTLTIILIYDRDPGRALARRYTWNQGVRTYVDFGASAARAQQCGERRAHPLTREPTTRSGPRRFVTCSPSAGRRRRDPEDHGRRATTAPRGITAQNWRSVGRRR